MTKNKYNDDTVINFDKYKSMNYTELAKEAENLEIPPSDRRRMLLEILKALIEKNNSIAYSGYLQIINNNHGMLRDIKEGFMSTEYDVHVNMNLIRKFNLRQGDLVTGILAKTLTDKKYLSLESVQWDKTNRVFFDDLTACYPTQQVVLENANLEQKYNKICRAIDILCPLGFGSRGLIYAPPFAGKTSTMIAMIMAISRNYPNATIIVTLVGERPEEVTDIRRAVPQVTVVASTFDNKPQDHVQSFEMSLNYAKRLVEDGNQVIIFVDSLTRVIQAYNSAVPSSGKMLSGGMDPNALASARGFFGSARNTIEAGSLTIVATLLGGTNSVFDALAYEAFKGTGSWDLCLSRDLFNQNIRPAIQVEVTGTRKAEEFVNKAIYSRMLLIKQSVSTNKDGVKALYTRLDQTPSNEELMKSIGGMPMGRS